MADGIIQVAPDSTGKKLDTSELTVGANTVERERVVWADPTTDVGLGVVTNANPAGTEYAPIVRPITPQDVGFRKPIIFYLDEITPAGTGETLATMNINAGGSTSSATQYTVTAGKTLRVQAVIFSALANATATKGRLRLRSAGTVGTGSPVFCALVCGAIGAVAGEGSETAVNFSDGLEFAAGQQMGLTYIVPATTVTLSACVVAYEY